MKDGLSIVDGDGNDLISISDITPISTNFGSSWTVPDLTGLAGNVSYLDSTGAYGVPWVVYYDNDTYTLYSGHADAPFSQQWVNEADLRIYPQSGGLIVTSIDMATIGLHPAVIFREVKEEKLIYAIFY